MELGSQNWKAVIQEGARAFQVDVTVGQAAQFAAHAAELSAWNRKINLTAIKDPLEIAVKHFLDTIAVSRHIPGGSRLLDIGSGGGFPGIVLKVVDPHLSVTLIDALRKRVTFLRHVIRTLGLEGIEARHIRAEDLAGEPVGARGFDIVICRALCALDEFVSMALPLRKKGGRIIAMKGVPDEGELASVESLMAADGNRHGAGRDTLRVIRYCLPFLNARRTLICIGPDP